jgi:hypothetical protein
VSAPERERNFWGAHACGVLAMAFCHRELLYRWPKANSDSSKESSLRQNAATSTL